MRSVPLLARPLVHSLVQLTCCPCSVLPHCSPRSLARSLNLSLLARNKSGWWRLIELVNFKPFLPTVRDFIWCPSTFLTQIEKMPIAAELVQMQMHTFKVQPRNWFIASPMIIGSCFDIDFQFNFVLHWFYRFLPQLSTVIYYQSSGSE